MYDDGLWEEEIPDVEPTGKGDETTARESATEGEIDSPMEDGDLVVALQEKETKKDEQREKKHMQRLMCWN